MPPRLSLRLTALLEMIPAHHYHTIWDTCCDHGLLGMSILQRQLAPHVCFVDQIPHITQTLNQQLATHFPTQSYRVMTGCTREIPLENTDDKTPQLVIIAGVGGDIVWSLVESLLKRNPSPTIDYLLAPNYHLFECRQQLSGTPLKLRAEDLIEERGRFYELLYLSPAATQTITATGAMWQWDNPIHQRYYQRLEQHYQRALAGPLREAAQEALSAYRAVRQSGHKRV